MSKPGKLLLSCDYFYPSVGGVEILMEDLGIRLLELGYHVEVSAKWLPGRKSDMRKGLKVHSFKCDGGLDPQGDEQERERFYRLISGGNFDHVLMLTQPDNWVASALLHKKDSFPPITLFPSINSLNVADWTKFGMWEQVKKVLKAADQTVAVTASGLDNLTLTKLGLNPVYLPHAIDKDAVKTNFREKHGLDPNRPLLVMVANFWPVKNHLNLLKILSRTKNDRQIVIIGNPVSAHMPYFEEVRKLAALDNRVTLIPGLPRPEAASAIRDADLLLIPSVGESAGPLVALQAMSYGTPWIATPNCNAVLDQAGGLSVSLEHFPEAIEYVLSDRKVRSELSRSGKEQWKDSFTWGKIIPAFDSMLQADQIPDFRISGDLRKKKTELQRNFYATLTEPTGYKTSPVFSIIIPTNNRSDILEKCLDALSCQTLPADQFEVIICDDGSTDNTKEVVEGYKASYQLFYIKQENSGPAKARNKGLKKARGRFVLFINDDTLLDKSSLDIHYETHLAHPGEKISVLGTFDFPENYRKSLFVRLIEENDLLFEYNKMQAGGYHDYNYFYTCNLSVPKQAVLDVGMFDETFDGPAAEDIDLGLRLYKKGYQLIYQPACKSWHDHPVTLHGFCRTHQVRGYGHMTLVSKHPELNYWLKIKNADLRSWMNHWTEQKTDVEKLLKELEKARVFEQENPKEIGRDDLTSIVWLLKNYFEAVGKMSHPYFKKLEAALETPGPLVSVIIPCHNYGKFLGECVESVMHQTYQSLEVIIVNDGSFDNTAEVADQLSNQYPQVSVITQRNSGQPAIARNNGIAAAKGDYILCLDADDKISPEFVEYTVRCLEQNPNATIAYPDQQDFGDKTDFEPHPEYSFRNLIRFNFIPPASLFRKEAWEAVGGFATNVVGYEDWDFWVACGEKGYLGKHVAEAIWHYRVHGDGLYHTQKDKDQRLKARVVMNHPGLYAKTQQEWAKGVLTGNADALRITGGLGMVPQFNETVKVGLACKTGNPASGNDPAGKHIVFTMYGWDDEGGGTILPRQLAKELVRRGNRVSVIYTPSKNRPDKSSYYVEQSEDNGVQLFAVYNRPAIFYDLDHPEREIDDPMMRQVVRSIISSLKPDIVHYHSFLNFSMGVAKDVHEMGIPSVYTSHNYWPLCPRMYLFDEKLNLCSGPTESGKKCASCINNSGKNDLYAARAEDGRTILNDYVDRHLAVSCRVKEIFITNGHKGEKIHVLHQQPEIADEIWEKVGARREIVSRLERPLRVGFMGSLLPQKGVHLLVQAMQAFSKNQVNGYVFGGGSKPVIEWLKSLDNTARVSFTGGYKPTDLPDLLQKIDVIVVPSIWEDCAPLVVAEALAARLPVIGARMGGIPDFIEDGRTGFLFPYNNVNELIQRIGTFVSDRTLLGKMQRQIIRNRTFDDYINDLLQHYNEVMSTSCAARQFKSEDEKPSVIWEGSQFVTHSLAQVNRSIGKQLLEKKFNLTLIPYEKDTFVPDKGTKDYDLYKCYGAPVLTDDKVHVRHHWPPNFTPPASGHWVMIQPWEFGSLPEKWIRPMSTQLDEIWVPSNYVKECYVRSGVPEDRVQVVPNGVDVETFKPSAQPYHLETKKAFKFLFVGGTIGRKGIDVLLDVYVRNFKATDDVCLVIKDMGGKSFYQGQTAAESIAQLQAHPDAPEIEYIDHELTDDEMAGLYTACDCLVHPYRGEGFGLPIAEAMSAGMPVIVTNHGAALDFCNQDNAWLIDAKEVKLKEKTIGNIPTVDYPWLAEPDSDSLAKCMRELLKSPGEAKKKAKKARETILNSFTWDCVGNKVEERLLEISKRPIQRLKPVSEVHWDNKEAFIQYFMQGVQRQTWDDLEKETHKACQRYSNDSYIWVLRAISLRMVSRFDEAIEAVKQSLKTSESPEALHEAIQIAEVTGKKEKAALLMEQLKLRFPEWTKTNISMLRNQR